MKIRQYMRPDITVSAIVHLSLVAFVVIYTEVRPFRAVVEMSVPVDVIVADEAEKEPEKKPDPLVIPTPSPSPSPSPDFSLLNPASQASSQAAAPQAASPPPSKQAARSARHEAAQPQQQATAPTPPAPQAAAPSYSPPEPDLTVKYHVMLGLPEDLPGPAPGSSGDKSGGGGDAAPATENLASSLVAPLRQHLKACSKMPAGLSPSDNVAVKLRVRMTPDGRLAAEPALIEGSASLKGVELMRGAIAALAACQPYAMLPADRYGEWKVLDLSFTPHDFNS